MAQLATSQKLRRLAETISAWKWSLLSTAIVLACADVLLNGQKRAAKKRIKSAEDSDPGLFKKYSTFESCTTSRATYPRIRVFYKEHYEASKLPSDLPLLVFTHGLGGSASQFASLLTSLVNVAPTLAVDFPGCGLSEFTPSSSQALSTHALAELLAAVIKRYRDAENNQKVILVGHSMGCSVSALLASSSSPLSHHLQSSIAGMVAICPLGGDLKPQQERDVRRVAKMPTLLFDAFRIWDRRGGIHSPGVSRMVGAGTDDETRKLQVKYNEQSQTHVFLSILSNSIGSEGMPGKDVWSGIKVPLFLVGAEADMVTPAAEVERIAQWLTPNRPASTASKPKQVASMPPMPATAGDAVNAGEMRLKKPQPPRTASGSIIKDDQTSSKYASALKTTIFPPPTGHALPYTTSTIRILAGMIENFLDHHVDHRLGRGWQLQQLQTSGKWDVKNYKKWQAVESCSPPIGSILRAMKTMREVDDEHRPSEFVKRFGYQTLDDGVAMVIDISHESPVYNPSALEEAGVEYHKFPTVSKQVPRAEEVEQFIALVDELRQTPKLRPKDNGVHPTVAVHCHYGYNRTGFFIVCYLVERLGYKLEDAIREFADKRPPRGIKHEYFIDELYVRYAVKGLARRGTVLRDEG